MKTSDFNFLGFVFDVDGTLYSQKKLRFSMAVRILLAFVTLRISINDIYVIYKFRRIKEHGVKSNLSFDEILLETSNSVKQSLESVKRIVNRWIFEVPLDLIKKYGYKDVQKFIYKKQQEGRKIIIYSDYSAVDKLSVLGIKNDFCFCFGDGIITEQKPSKASMECVLKSVGIPKNQLAYIGDRDDRDKKSALLFNITYYDIRKFRKYIKNATY